MINGMATRLQEKNRSQRGEIEQLKAALAVMWHAYDTDNRPPHHVIKIARKCYEEGRH